MSERNRKLAVLGSTLSRIALHIIQLSHGRQFGCCLRMGNFMGIHPTAYIHPAAVVHPSCELGPHVVIDGPVRISADCRLGPSVIVLGHAEIGIGTSIHSHAVIGDVPQDHKYTGAVSFCRIGERCVIREGVTIHRACTESFYFVDIVEVRRNSNSGVGARRVQLCR